MAPARWDVFCRVVDNLGDAGVSWRLARELVSEHGLAVTLWIDDRATLARIAPGADAGEQDVRLAGVRIRTLPPPAQAFARHEMPEVVIEAFGGGLPDPYLDAMAALPRPPLWFVLEYLSAEPWIEGWHGLRSVHPRTGLERRVWFPGFTARTGGLLRDRAAVERLGAGGGPTAAKAPFGRAEPIAFVSPVARVPAAGAVRIGPGGAGGVPDPDAQSPPPIRVLVFCYTNPRLRELLECWSRGAQPVECLVPEGVAVAERLSWGAAPGAVVSRGSLTLREIAFVPQDRFDDLLAACDVTVVRGEDSFVRAQWAARPFVWHIYPQEGGAHRAKLEAFLGIYLARAAPEVAGAVRALTCAFNSIGDVDLGRAWERFAGVLPAIEGHAVDWAREIAALPDLASGLVKASRTLL